MMVCTSPYPSRAWLMKSILKALTPLSRIVILWINVMVRIVVVIPMSGAVSNLVLTMKDTEHTSQ